MFTLISPAKITWEITTKCTGNCELYYNSSSPSREFKLDEAQINTIAQNIIDCNPLLVEITGGEPLVCGNMLFTVIKKFKEKGIIVHLFTNADLIDEETAKELSICDSIRLPITDLKNSLIGDASLENVLRAIKLLNDTEIEISILLSKKVINRLGELVEMFRQYPNIKRIAVLPIINTSPHAEGELKVTRNEFNEQVISLSELSTKNKKYFKIYYVDDSNEIKNVIKNKQFYYSVYIKEDGSVMVNQWFWISAGNVLETPLPDIWNNSLKDFWYKQEVKQYFRGFKNLSETGGVNVGCGENVITVDEVINQGCSI